MLEALGQINENLAAMVLQKEKKGRMKQLVGGRQPGKRLFMIQKTIQQIEFLVAPESQIAAPLPGILIAQIHLLPYHKVKACQDINKLLKESVLKDWQVILTVINDEHNRYVRLISNGVVSKDVNTDELINGAGDS